MENTEHFLKCRTCGEYFDMRDLSQVAEHEHSGIDIKGKYNSKKVGEPTEYLKDKTSVNLN